MYKHSDFNNHFYLGRSPVLLAGLTLAGEGVRDEDAARWLAEGFDLLFNHQHPALNSLAGDMGGWHESLGYFDGEMGLPVMVQMDGLRTATGLDFFQDSGFWRTLPFWYLASTVPWDGSLIHWADQGKDRWARALDGSESEGKGTRVYLTGLAHNLRRLGYPEAEQAQHLLDHHIGVFYDSAGYAESFYKVNHLHDVLWHEPGAPSRGLEDARSSSHLSALGEVILREGDDPDDALAMFACADFRGGHQQSDNGHFSLWYRGYLAVDSGYYDGWGSEHHMRYARRTIAHNTLTVTMPGETFRNTDHNDGGQAWSCDTVYYDRPGEDPACDACDMVLSTREAPRLDVVSADLTRSYHPDKVDLVTRRFVWLRPDLFVVFDRVEVDDAAYAKRFLLHGQGPFVEADDAWRVEHGEGALFVRTLLPAGARVEQVGGPGREWEVGGVNYPPARGADFAGTHRLEVSPPEPAAFDVFLHLLQVTDQGADAMAQASVLTTGEAAGVLVRDRLVWFGTRGRIDGLAFDLDAGRPVHVVVTDVAPDTRYGVRLGDATIAATSDAHGVLTFDDDRSDAHAVRIGGDVPPPAEPDAGGPEEEADAGREAGRDDAGASVDVSAPGGPGAPATTRAGRDAGCGCRPTRAGATASTWLGLLVDRRW